MMSRDGGAAVFGLDWGRGAGSPIVSGTPAELPAVQQVEVDALLPKADAAVLVLDQDKGHMAKRFGVWIAQDVAHRTRKVRSVASRRAASSVVFRPVLRSPLMLMLAFAPSQRCVTSSARRTPFCLLPFEPPTCWRWTTDRCISCIMIGCAAKTG